jgi:hypothetical protein
MEQEPGDREKRKKQIKAPLATTIKKNRLYGGFSLVKNQRVSAIGLLRFFLILPEQSKSSLAGVSG